MSDIHDEFAALVKRIEIAHTKCEQRDTAMALVLQAQEWVRALEKMRAES